MIGRGLVAVRGERKEMLGSGMRKEERSTPFFLEWKWNGNDNIFG